MKKLLMTAAVATAVLGLATQSVAAPSSTDALASPPQLLSPAGDTFFALSTVDTETDIDGGSFSFGREPETYALLLGALGATLFLARRRRQS
jgi:hypothetical protein